MGNIVGRFLMPHPPIIIPEVGRGEDKGAEATKEGCRKIAEEVKNLKPEVIVLITPHGPVFRDAIAITHMDNIEGDLGDFRASGVDFKFDIDVELTDKIITYSQEDSVPIVKIDKKSERLYKISSNLDHGAMIPLYFIREKYTDFKLIHITYGILSNIDLYRFGMAVKRAVEDSNVNAVFIASGDLSHRLSEDGPYGYNPYGEKFDKEVLELLKTGDTLKIFDMDRKTVEEAGECGLRSIYILTGTLEGESYRGEILSYEGPFGVGYGNVIIRSTKDDSQNILDKLQRLKEDKIKEKRKSEDIYIKLARESLEYYIKHGDYIKIPSYVTEEMLNNKRGAFVSIKKEGELRGCIGTILPAYDSLAEEIIKNAVQAGENDPRFYPIDEGELDELEYSVDVLMEPERAIKEELDVKRYGVIVRSVYKTGLLLPDLNGVDTVDEQINIALQKAGISKNETYTIERFEVIRHS